MLKDRLSFAGAGGVAAFAIALPFLTDNIFHLSVAALALINMLLALGMNAVMGHTGLIHAGYAAFYGVGGYAVAVAMVWWNVSFWLALPAACLLAAIVAVAIGVPAIRVSGIYYVLVMLGFGEILRITATNTGAVGGPDGVFGIPRPSIGEFVIRSPEHIYWLILAAVLLSFIAMHRLANSRVVRAWNYLREDETAATVLGVSPVWGKLQATFLGGLWAGMGGAFFALRQTAVAPSSFTFFDSFIVIIIIALGGLRSMRGVILGTLAVIVLPELLRPVQEYRFIAFGLAIILMMRFRPSGLWPGDVGKRYKKTADDIVDELGQAPPEPVEEASA
jgi:branched-chain amino acid transport system permease protein